MGVKGGILRVCENKVPMKISGPAEVIGYRKLMGKR
jgi:hypothetical protein